MSVSALFTYLNAQTCVILGFVFLLAYWYLRTRAAPKLPPGPWALPGLGNVLQMATKVPHLTWTELGKTYGPVVYLRLGSQQIVVLNSYSAIHEALVRKGEDFSGRPAWYTFQQMGFMDYGLIMLPYGPFWKQQRKFTIMGLRDFGFGKRSLEGKIAEESQGLREEILKKGDTPFNIRLLLQNAVGNVICSIVLGKRFEYEDKKFEKIMKAFDQNLGAEQQLSALANFFPWARHIPVVKKAIALVKENVENCMATMREDIAEHKATFDPNDIRDFIDTFLLEMRNQEGEEGGEFTDRQLEYLIGDLFLAGTETTSSTLTWALLYMLRHQEVQDKVHREIDSTIGQDVTPSISHRSLLPYTEAVITEVMRINPIAATGAMHNTSNDTTLFGYDIPKDTVVFPNLWAVLHDPEVYPEPDVFKPERFLDDSKFKKGDTFIPFSLGRRACLGEQLARMELFLFFTSLMQHFTFKLPEGAALPSTRGKAGITNNAEDFDLCAIPRE
ncbi:CYP2J2 [Branchiostoma lanceolatum]|uniref:Cytochrome P450 2U1 n=2 Tax=Branchiostoma lanceolatum TaxID=7740 RepID=A0A8J9ZQB6_BRALA|nr:CYP2J2 [Branchiostoma lanceolatum]